LDHQRTHGRCRPDEGAKRKPGTADQHGSVSADLTRRSEPEDQKHQEDYEKQEEQDMGDLQGRALYPGKTKGTGQKADNKKDNSPAQHGVSLSFQILQGMRLLC
jgi:hypothetical protein